MNEAYSQLAGMDFNSRPYTRGDGAREATAVPCSYFNSRPYTRGDNSAMQEIDGQMNFNSRPYTRGDKAGYGLAQWTYQFQFPPLHEGRHCYFLCCNSH